MATKDNWLVTNLKLRLTDPTVDFKVGHRVKKLERLSWEQALRNTILEFESISKKLFIPLSGGMDSEFVFNSLIHLDPIPIIVDTPANKLESAYAFHYCRKHNLTPVVIEKSEYDLLRVYVEDIFTKINGVGASSVAALLAARYAEQNDGIVVIGEHAYDGVSEWDFYNDVLINEDNSIYFFMWTPELVQAMQQEYRGEDHQEFKHRLYEIAYRPKMIYQYSDGFETVLRNLNEIRKAKPNVKSEITFNVGNYY